MLWIRPRSSSGASVCIMVPLLVRKVVRAKPIRLTANRLKGSQCDNPSRIAPNEANIRASKPAIPFFRINPKVAIISVAEKPATPFVDRRTPNISGPRFNIAPANTGKRYKQGWTQKLGTKLMIISCSIGLSFQSLFQVGQR